MFADMGEGTDEALDAMVTTARPVLEAGLRDGSYRGWLIEREGRVVAGGGVLLIGYQPSPADLSTQRVWVLNVYTEPDCRGEGLARLVMTTILNWCHGKGFGSVSLHASRDGRRLYESLGFKPTNEMRLVLGDREI